MSRLGIKGFLGRHVSLLKGFLGLRSETKEFLIVSLTNPFWARNSSMGIHPVRVL